MNFVKVPQTLLTFSTTMLTPINTFAQTMMHTINGKLIIVNASEFDEVKQLVAQIDRKCDRLESQQAIAPSLPQGESVEKIHAIGLSVQKLRTIYSRLFWVVLASSLGLNAANFFMLRSPSCAVESSKGAIERELGNRE